MGGLAGFLLVLGLVVLVVPVVNIRIAVFVVVFVLFIIVKNVTRAGRRQRIVAVCHEMGSVAGFGAASGTAGFGGGYVVQK